MTTLLSRGATVGGRLPGATRPWSRWAPLATGIAAVAAILLQAGTDPLDLVRFAAYAVFAIMLPGTLTYRALRGEARTLAEDVAMGAAVGLCLELPAWAVLSVLDLRAWAPLWPVAVILPFAVVRGLRRCWRGAALERVPLGWAWAMTGIVVWFTGYLAIVFLDRNPVLPDGEGTRQYLDLAYQLSLAGEAKHHVPLDVPQLAGTPLHYHWFGYAHMAMVSLVGHIDLPVVSLRLVVPALSALAILLTGVIGWRLSGRPFAGVGAAVLFWVVGEITFSDPVAQPFGTQSMFVVWHGMSMIYSWVLLLALIAAIVSALRAPRWQAFTLAGVLALASSGAKASSLPVTLLGLAVTGAVMLVACRRVPWTVVGLGAIVAGAQLFATAVLFHFETYGLTVDFLANLRVFWEAGDSAAAVVAAFLISMLIKYVGAIPALREGFTADRVFLFASAFAGPLLYLVFASLNSQYFTRAGFTFGVLIAAWGWSVAWDRLSTVQRRAAAAGAAIFAVGLVVIQLGTAPSTGADGYIRPILHWSMLVGAVILTVCFALRGTRAALPVALTLVLVAGAPAYVMDMAKSLRAPNGGAYFNVTLAQTRVDAARWVRAHSSPDDILATNVHCRAGSVATGDCDPVSFWLAAYAEREVLVESWGFAPERFAYPDPYAFWQPELLALNDRAFTAPDPATLDALRSRGVRWLVADRAVAPESPHLADLVRLAYDNGRIAVYRL